MTKCLKLQDLVFLPEQPVFKNNWPLIEKLISRNLLPKILKDLEIPDDFKNWTDDEKEIFAYRVIPLINCVSIPFFRKGEPAWLKLLPAPLQRHLQIADAFERYDPWDIVPTVPFTGIGYIIKEGYLTEKACRAFGLFRLCHVKQLGYLNDPAVSECEMQTFTRGFSHSRYSHSIDAAALIVLMSFNNQLSQNLIAHAQLSALAHDAMTPAGGDTVKLVCPEIFDEDANFEELLERFNWSELRKEYKISQDLLVATVHGQGLLGELLDISDKISYVSGDLYAYLNRYSPQGPIAYPEGYKEIDFLVKKLPYICSVWDCVKIIDKHAVFTNPFRLANFLKLRALLFRELYFHPGARFKEHLLASVIVKYLFSTGRITKNKLLTIDDHGLGLILDQFFGQKNSFSETIGIEDPRVETFRTERQALLRESELMKMSDLAFTHIEKISNAKPATHFPVMTSKGIMPFCEALPKLAKEIQSIAEIKFPYRLYYSGNGRHCGNKNLLKAFKYYRQERLSKITQ